MTQTVWIVLIVAAVIAVFLLRRTLRTASLKVPGVTTSLTAETPTAVARGVSNNSMLGTNEIDTVESGAVSDNSMLGKNRVTVRGSSETRPAQKPPSA